MANAAKKSQPNNFQLAGRVARVVELQSVRLVGARMDSEIVGSDPEVIKLDQQYKHRYESLADSGLLRVFIAFRLSMAPDEQQGSPFLRVEGEYALDYSLPADAAFAPIELAYFAELNGTLNVWPYWRELVHSVVARAGLGNITLPVWRATPQAVDPALLEADGETRAAGQGN